MVVRYLLRAIHEPVLVTLLVVVAAASRSHAQLYREIPGKHEFTGEMLVRPLQIEDWMQRGFTEEESRERHRQTAEWLVAFLDDRLLNHHARADRYRFRLREFETENVMGAFLLEQGTFRYVCPNWRLYPQSIDCTNDPYLDTQWHHKVMESCAGWQIHTNGDDDVVLTFVDFGLRRSHLDLSTLSQYRRLAYDAENQLWESDPNAILFDGINHGTPVNGCGAATGNNSIGVSGVGWTLRHRMIKTSGTVSEFFDAMWVTADVGDRVFSVQYAPDVSQDLWDDESKALVDAYDVVICVSAGNDPSLTDYRDYTYIIVVGGTELNNGVEEVWYDDANWGSQTGDMIDVMAPAKSVYSCSNANNDAYKYSTGTSFAAPLAAGLAALIWSYDPTLSGTQVRDLIFQGCVEFSGWNEDEHGHGSINVFNSLALASGELWTREPYPGTAGTTNGFKAAGGTPTATVTFYYGTATGSTSVTGCTGLNVDIDSAQVLGTATVGANGAAKYFTTVPSGWSNTTIYLQCVEIANCRKSNRVEYTFP